VSELLVIRAHGGRTSGTGHIMRCLALAQAWKDRGGACLFVLGEETGLEGRLVGEGMEIARVAALPGSAADAAQTVAQARDRGARRMVVDGYCFDAGFQSALRAAGLIVLFVDDYGQADRYEAELVLNQNLYATEALYPSRRDGTRLLLGTRFALLRREFTATRPAEREFAGPARRILVTFGGADPDNLTQTVIEHAVALPGQHETVVLVGASNPHRAALERAAAGSSTVSLVSNASDMPARIAWCDVAIAAGGSTAWELAYLGAPMILAVLADNQTPVARSLADAGAAIDLGRAPEFNRRLRDELGSLLSDGARRRSLSDAGRAILDGRGAERVVEELRRG
jgi:UDP-2,4-diacetamido-2,4,6-trideoxy-beta-L-altropyranose hydrolase